MTTLERTTAEAAAALLDWFARTARDLPWRRTTDPYAVYVSEVMLQQTQVKTVIPYWERWMARFPDVQTLAAAAEDDVLKHWEGLGYYSRARRLQQAARVIVGAGGGLPRTYSGWLELPGIGPYTAGAVASIALDIPVPAVDGNVIRVITRFLALKGNPASPAVMTKVRTRATRWVEAADASRRAAGGGYARPCSMLNQAVMELGATICTPRQPKCGECPLAVDCHAKASGDPERFPELSARPAAERRDFAVIIAHRNGCWWVRRRPAGGVNEGLWEFPALAVPEGRSPREVAAAWLGVEGDRLAAEAAVRHTITRYRITSHPFVFGAARRKALPGEGRWAGLEELRTLAFAGAHRRLADRVLGAPPGRAGRAGSAGRT